MPGGWHPLRPNLESEAPGSKKQQRKKRAKSRQEGEVWCAYLCIVVIVVAMLTQVARGWNSFRSTQRAVLQHATLQEEQRRSNEAALAARAAQEAQQREAPPHRDDSAAVPTAPDTKEHDAQQ